jgi:tellurite resistance protein TerC
MWVLFLSVVLALLIIDLGILNKKDKEIGVKESLWMSAFYIIIAILFGGWVWYQLGMQSFAEYMTGFIIEKTLALDNIFLISLVFSTLSIPLKFQHRVLFWGILGVIVLRAIMIALGAELINRFHWILYIFGIILILTGIKMFFVMDKKVDINDNILLKWMRKYLRITDKIHGQKFLVHYAPEGSSEKQLYITPLFVALILIEFIDLIFAIDSIPAIFTITKDPYIVYTSNIFAILGLRALYFALAAIISRFYYLKFALAIVLIFIGSKVFIADLLGLEKFPASISLVVTFILLSGGCMYSLYRSKQKN